VRRHSGVASTGGAVLLTASVVLVASLWSGSSRPPRPAAQANPSKVIQPAPLPLPSRSVAPAGAKTPYQRAIDAAAARGLEVWLDVDLAQRWLQGPRSFMSTIRRLAPLARRPGVVGFKIADELGYQDGFRTTGQIRAFLADAASGLRRVAPRKLILADILVPELGCAQGVLASIVSSFLCAQQARARYPALSLSSVDTYVRSGDLDAIDLSTDLLPETTYESWGITQAQAQRAAWREVAVLRWSTYVTVRERHALAHPGRYTGSASDAQRNAFIYASIPLSEGAAAIDIWAWQQVEDGVVMRLMDPGLRSNALWRMLIGLHDRGVEMYTSFTPTSVDRGIWPDLAKLAKVFTGVMIAAGV
jgi:hypothetical protein